MNRNTEARFHSIPRIEVRRSKFDRSHGHTTTFNEGDLIPIYVAECLPGDQVRLNLNSLVRMSTPLYPVMDNAYTDYYAFFCPNRLLWEHWVNLMGENTDSFWAPKTEYTTPKTAAPSGGWNIGTIADYMGIPTGVENIKVNSMPLRAYARIWNEWFRDENLQQPVVQDMDDATSTGSNTGTELSDAQNGGLPLKAAKYHDYFTSCLPSPQKGEAVTLPLGNLAPIVPTDMSTKQVLTEEWDNRINSNTASYWLHWQPDSNDTLWVQGTDTNGPQPAYLYTDLSTATAATVEQLRQAIAIEHILEADARGGTRYTEILANQFGVTAQDSRLQRTEYIGGTRMPVNISQVVQQSSTTETSPQGNTAAYSLTTGKKHIISYACKEHGYILILAVTRVEHSYQQGLSRMWTRTDRYSYYHPMLAELGEMAVLNQEIYAQGTEEDEEVFGYQEAWADYRYSPSYVSGFMRSTAAQTLDAWHYADKYDALPMLSSDWIKEGTENIDRTLAVQSEVSHQFLANFWFDETWVRPMPIYSVPGLHTL